MNNIIEHEFQVSREAKEHLLKTKGIIFWLTGLSGSGKSTIASELEKLFIENKKFAAVIDGDTVRSGLCRDLKFSQEDRLENLRRVAEVAKLYANNGIITICCFISPLEKQRELIKSVCGDDWKLIYINADLEICEKRDPKGLYKKARAGEIKNFTGIDSKYEIPSNPDLVIDTKSKTAKESAIDLFKFYQEVTK